MRDYVLIFLGYPNAALFAIGSMLLQLLCTKPLLDVCMMSQQSSDIIVFHTIYESYHLLFDFYTSFILLFRTETHKI